MLIYFNGDSNVAGAELIESTHGMANRLTEMFNQRYLAKFINDATPGASNDLIYETTIDFLKNPDNPKPDLIVIGWTEFNRIQWFLVDEWNKGRLWEINQIGAGIQVPEEYKERYQHWKNHVESDGHWQLVQSTYWHNKIYNLHCMLDFQKIPHLFFNAFNYFVLPHYQHQLNWNNTFLSPYNNSLIYTEWCKQNGYQEITPGLMHFDDRAHTQWAKLMYSHIKQHNIL